MAQAEKYHSPLYFVLTVSYLVICSQAYVQYHNPF